MGVSSGGDVFENHVNSLPAYPIDHYSKAEGETIDRLKKEGEDKSAQTEGIEDMINALPLFTDLGSQDTEGVSDTGILKLDKVEGTNMLEDTDTQKNLFESFVNNSEIIARLFREQGLDREDAVNALLTFAKIEVEQQDSPEVSEKQKMYNASVFAETTVSLIFYTLANGEEIDESKDYGVLFGVSPEYRRQVFTIAEVYYNNLRNSQYLGRFFKKFKIDKSSLDFESIEHERGFSKNPDERGFRFLIKQIENINYLTLLHNQGHLTTDIKGRYEDMWEWIEDDPTGINYLAHYLIPRCRNFYFNALASTDVVSSPSATSTEEFIGATLDRNSRMESLGYPAMLLASHMYEEIVGKLMESDPGNI